MNYWEEIITETFEQIGLEATQEQIKTVAESISMAHEMYSEAHGHLCIPNPLEIENEKLKSELEQEKQKRVCDECKGAGNITTPGPYHSSISQCWKCKGEGKI